MNPPTKISIPLFPIALILALASFFGVSSNSQAVSPPPDGGYPGGNTAEGQNALLSLVTGAYNTAVGFSSLKSNTIGTLNTALGVNAMVSNTTGVNNTATGADALYNNTIGFQNTANGGYALFFNTAGSGNIAIGPFALYFNTIGSLNTAIGGSNGSLPSGGTLFDNTTGSSNTAVGASALGGSNGDGNTAVGSGALIQSSGNFNTALGQNAGQALRGGESNNIYIGANVDGVRGESNTIRIGNTDITDTFISGISGTTVASGAAVFVDSNGHLGTVTSSKRFKEDIKPMNKASEALYALEPVSFRYKKEIDPVGTSQVGLIAEDVEKVSPNLIVRDKKGKAYSVRYDQVNAMLLNEFLKEHKKTEKLEATVASLIATVKEQAAQIQKVSAQLEAIKPVSQVVNNP